MSKIQLKGFFQPAVLGSLFLAFFYFGILKPFGILEVPKLKAQDLFFKIRNHIVKPPSILDQIALIVIDDESIDKSNQKWPFKRKVFADLINALSRTKPRVIAFDFVFSGKSDPVDDFLLSHSLENATAPVVLASFVDPNGNYILPHPQFLPRLVTAGAINKLQDRDFTVRRVNMDYRDREGKKVGSAWELEIAKAFGFEKKSNMSDQVLINYRFGFDQVDKVPFWQFKQNPDLSRFTDKIVLIGTTSKVLHDFYQTPLGLLPGVVINMNLLTNILSDDFMRQLPSVVSVVFIFLISFAGIYLSLKKEIVPAFLAFAGISILFLFIQFVFFLNHYLSDYFIPLLFGWLSFVSVSFYRYFFTLLENVQLKNKIALDPLTGLYNRRFMESTINEELQRGHELSVLMVDIDNFKSINDTYGHQFGDDVIKNISFSIKEELREGDIAVRYGGEEFCVILLRIDKADAAQIGEKIRKRIAACKFSYVNEVTSFTVSIGVASSKTDRLTASRSLIRAADQALYHAKKTGKNRVSLY